MEDRKREREIYRVTIVGSVGNFLLLMFKFIAGVAGHSAAMVADAVHSLSDFVTDVVVLLFVRLSNRPRNKNYDYGHGKYETLATALIGIALLGVGAGICWNGATAIYAYAKGEALEQPGMVALIAAVVSIVVKEVLYRYTVLAGRRVTSQAVIANAWHHRSDALSSIGTAAGIGGAILLGEEWRVLDPIAALVVSLFIVRVAYKLLRPCAEELMDKSLPEEVEQEIERALLAFDGVSRPHNLRTRKIGNYSSVEVHVCMDGGMTVAESHEITRAMERRIREILGGGTFVNIHVEPAE
jgi:cation diffusion facilitator family transporter